MEQITGAFVDLVTIAVVGFLGYAARQVGTYFQSKGLDKVLQTKRTSVGIAVNAVEQIVKAEGLDAKVKSKYDEAKARAIEILAANKIKIDSAELDSLIEDAVKAMNGNFKQGISIDNESFRINDAKSLYINTDKGGK